MSVNKSLMAALMGAAVLAGGFASAQAAEVTETRVYKWQTFADWDADKSGFIEAPEYQKRSFVLADVDGDGFLENEEWVTYTHTFYDPVKVKYDVITKYDMDGDGYVDQIEYKKFTETPDSLFTAWDYDKDKLINIIKAY